MKNDRNFDPAFYDAKLQLTAENTTCDMCGKQFDEWDAQENFGCDMSVGYGSKYDTYRIKINLCCDCFDKFFDSYIVPNCKTNPIVDEERHACGEYGPLEAARMKRINSFLSGEMASDIKKRIRNNELSDDYLDELENQLKEKEKRI